MGKQKDSQMNKCIPEASQFFFSITYNTAVVVFTYYMHRHWQQMAKILLLCCGAMWRVVYRVLNRLVTLFTRAIRCMVPNGLAAKKMQKRGKPFSASIKTEQLIIILWCSWERNTFQQLIYAQAENIDASKITKRICKFLQWMCVSAVSLLYRFWEYLFECEQICNRRLYETRTAAFHTHGHTQMPPHPQLKLLQHSIYY